MDAEKDTNLTPSVEFVRAFQRLLSEVIGLNGLIMNTAELLSKDLDLTPARWGIIAVIRNEPMTVPAISKRLGQSRQSIQQTVNRLEKQDIIEFVDNPNHRTSPLVQLTEQGRKIMDILRNRQIHSTMQFTSRLGYSIEELDRMTSRLRHMREHSQQFDTSQFVTRDSDN